jgi:deazaflavin-dependent oxidoreductase (nitroreductase family)
VRPFEELVAEAAAAPADGWDFTWLDGRATEQRPSWGYARLLGERMTRARSTLDLQTGRGQILAAVPVLPGRVVATESWPPNVPRAAATLAPRGGSVVVAPDGGPLPFADGSFDLVVSRHPVTTPWPEIGRVLAGGGTFLAQEVGPASMLELIEFFLGPQPPDVRRRRHPDQAVAAARAAGLDVLDVRAERPRAEFFDVGAVIYFLRTVIWTVPDFSVERYRERLAALDERIRADGVFVAHSARYLIEARRPGGPGTARRVLTEGMPLTGEYEPSPVQWVRDQVELYESSGGTQGTTLRDKPVIILTTLGAKSGKIRKSALMRVEHDGAYAVVASLGGAPTHPVWYHNVVAHPLVELQDGPVKQDMIAREVTGEEKAAWWERAVEAWPDYAHYQTKTDRQIPVIVLEPIPA